MMKSLPLGIALSLLLLSTHAGAANMCSMLVPGQLEAALGTTITGKEEFTGPSSVACNYDLAEGIYGPGLFFLQRFTIDLPAGHEHEMMMHTPNSNFVKVPGVGDKAIIVDDTWEMMIQKGPTFYHFATRAVPCEKTDGNRQDESARCHKARTAMLHAVAKLVTAF